MEKSSFQQMFNQLSHRLKEKRALMGIAERMEDRGQRVLPFPSVYLHKALKSADSAQPQPTTMDLLKNMVCSAPALSPVGDQSPEANATANAALNDLRCHYHVKAADLQHMKEALNNKMVKTDQITIFYAGSVHVFDDFPISKMKELTRYAANFSPNHISGHFFVNGGGTNKTGQINLAGTQNSRIEAGNSPHRQLFQAKTEAASDLPIARRASLQRFLSKRKDRASTRVPYIRCSIQTRRGQFNSPSRS